MPDRQFLQLADVAEVLDVSVKQVEALIDRGELIAVQIGGRGVRRIKIAALDDYIARLEREAEARAEERRQQRQKARD